MENRRNLSEHVFARVDALVEHLVLHPEALAGSPHTRADLDRFLSRADWKTPITDYVNAMPRAFLEMELEAFGAGLSGGSMSDMSADLIRAILTDESSRKAFTMVHPVRPDLTPAKEYWLISQGLYARLAILGEAVGTIFGLAIWGRCAAGPLAVDPLLDDCLTGMPEVPYGPR